MNCQETLLLLQAYLDGELEGEDRRAVASHLQACSACRRECAAQHEVLGGLTQALAEETQAPAGLRAAVLQQVAAEPYPDHRTAVVAGSVPCAASSRVRRLFAMRSFRIAFSAAGVLAVLATTVWFLFGQDLAFAKAIDSALQGIKSAHFTAVEGDRTVEVWATPDAERVSTTEGWMVSRGGRAYLFDRRHQRLRVTQGAAAHLKLLRSLNVLLLSERLRGHALGSPRVTKEKVTLPDGRPAIRVTGEAQARRSGVVCDYSGTMLIDLATNLILSGEATQRLPDTAQAKRLEREGRLRPMHLRVESIEYNQPVPKGSFDTNTPKGWTVSGRR